MKPKCVIFDCDGVLVDSVDLSIKVLIRMARAQGLDLKYNFAFERFGGSSLRSSFDYIEEQTGKSLPKSSEKQYRKKTYEIFKKELKAIDGIHDTLKRLPIPFCVASGGPPEKIKLNLMLTNLIDHFEGRIFSSYEINSWKPDPGIFTHAAEKMGFHAAECLVIEDSIDGVNAAISGGFQVFGYVPSIERNSLSSFDIKLFHKMSLLPDLVFETE
ncbi:MAG: HAD family hydrolase [Bacteroidota bacterium]